MQLPLFVQTYFVLNGLFNGEDGVFACTTGVGKQQPDGWYWLMEGMDDGKDPFESREAAQKAALADPKVIASKKEAEILAILANSGGWHHKPTSWDEVGNPLAASFLDELDVYDAHDLGIGYSLGKSFSFKPESSIFLVKWHQGYYLVRTGGSDYARGVRYVGHQIFGETFLDNPQREEAETEG